MKIGYFIQSSPDIINPPFDGPANHIRQLAQELIQLGHSVKLLFGINGIFFITTDLINFQKVARKKKKLFVSLFEKSIRRLQSIFHLPYFGWFESQSFSYLVEEHLAACDAWMERTGWMAYGGYLASRRRKIPIIQEFNGDPLIDLESTKQAPLGFQREIAKFLYRKNLIDANRIIATGEGWRENLLQVWRIPSEKITVIENGTILIDFLQRDQLWRTNAEIIKIVFLGGFYKWHGTDLLIEAFSQCLEKYQNIQLILIGAGSGLAETQQAVKMKGLDDRIKFTGQLTFQEYAPILSQSQIGVSPVCGRNEYSCLKLFDYKAAGLAIISSGEDGQPATLQDGVTGLIVPPCDLVALTNALERLIENRELRQELAYNARLDAELSNGWQHTAENVIKVLQTSSHYVPGVK